MAEDRALHEDEPGARSAMRDAVDRSRAAPSEHNSQPWRWVLHHEHLELFVDPSRRLPFTDPRGRGVLLGCGCALHHCRIALAAAGWHADVRLGTDRRAEPVARLRVRRVDEVDRSSTRHAAAIDRRRSDRRRFSDHAPGPAEIEALVDTARAWDATVNVVVGGTRRLLAQAMRDANRVQRDQEGYAAELQRWTHRYAGARDGVPDGARLAEPDAVYGDLPLQRFAGGGLRQPWRGHDRADASTVMVLSATDDSPVSALRAGEALSAVLLEATALGLATQPMTQVLEVPETRERVRYLVAAHRSPAVILRVGHPVPGAEPLAPTPRRPLAAVLFEDDDASAHVTAQSGGGDRPTRGDDR